MHGRIQFSQVVDRPAGRNEAVVISRIDLGWHTGIQYCMCLGLGQVRFPVVKRGLGEIRPAGRRLATKLELIMMHACMLVSISTDRCMCQVWYTN
jgi:hypothetical protein